MKGISKDAWVKIQIDEKRIKTSVSKLFTFMKEFNGEWVEKDIKILGYSNELNHFELNHVEEFSYDSISYIVSFPNTSFEVLPDTEFFTDIGIYSVEKIYEMVKDDKDVKIAKLAGNDLFFSGFFDMKIRNCNNELFYSVNAEVDFIFVNDILVKVK